MRKRSVYTLLDVPHVSPTGEERAQALGQVVAVVHRRTSEERTENDLECAAETAYALIPSRCSPPGGFVRGMVLADGTARYRMLTPVCHGSLWCVKCIRMHL